MSDHYPADRYNTYRWTEAPAPSFASRLRLRLYRQYVSSSVFRAVFDLVRPSGAPIDHHLAHRLSPPRRILDVGCGAGQGLAPYREAGWETWGVEISLEAGRQARQRGHRVIVGRYPDVSLPGGYFGLVRIRHTLEHLPDPRRALTRAYDVLVPGGKLLLELPNISGVVARVSGRFYWQLDPPRHLVLPSPQGLRQILHDAGFAIDSWRTYSHGAGLANCIYLGLLHRDRPRARWHPGADRPPFGYSVVARSLEPAALVLDLMQAGDNIRVVARRKERGSPARREGARRLEGSG